MSRFRIKLSQALEIIETIEGTIDYSAEEINDVIKSLTFTLKAKAYDVVYRDYAELIVADEMGYFDPTALVRADGEDIEDTVLANLTMWNEDTCESINDAILALRAKKGTLDRVEDTTVTGPDSISGGYLVQSDNGASDNGQEYTFTGGVKSAYSLVSTKNSK